MMDGAASMAARNIVANSAVGSQTMSSRAKELKDLASSLLTLDAAALSKAPSELEGSVAAVPQTGARVEAAESSAAAKAATIVGAGSGGHSPRSTHQRRISTSMEPPCEALAAATQIVKEKQKQLLHRLDSIAAGERLLMQRRQREQRIKAPTTRSRITAPVMGPLQHPEELRQQKRRQLLQQLQAHICPQEQQNPLLEHYHHLQQPSPKQKCFYSSKRPRSSTPRRLHMKLQQHRHQPQEILEAQPHTHSDMMHEHEQKISAILKQQEDLLTEQSQHQWKQTQFNHQQPKQMGYGCGTFLTACADAVGFGLPNGAASGSNNISPVNDANIHRKILAPTPALKPQGAGTTAVSPVAVASSSTVSSSTDNPRSILKDLTHTIARAEFWFELLLVLVLCSYWAAAAPHSLVFARRQQLQELAASKADSLLHFTATAEAAAVRCALIAQARDAFKNHVTINGWRLHRNVINTGASSRSLGIYTLRAAAAAWKGDKLHQAAEAALATEQELKKKAEELLPYKLCMIKISGAYGNPMALLKQLQSLKATKNELQKQTNEISRRIEEGQSAFLRFKETAKQAEGAYLATMSKIRQELEEAEAAAESLEAAAETVDNKHREAAATLGLICQKTHCLFQVNKRLYMSYGFLFVQKYASSRFASRCYFKGLEKVAVAARSAPAESPSTHRQQQQELQYLVAQQQLSRLRVFCEHVEAVFEVLQEDGRKSARARAGRGKSSRNGERFSVAPDTWNATGTKFTIDNVKTAPFSVLGPQEVVEFITEGGQGIHCPNKCQKDSFPDSRSILGAPPATGFASSASSRPGGLPLAAGGKRPGRHVRTTVQLSSAGAIAARRSDLLDSEALSSGDCFTNNRPFKSYRVFPLVEVMELTHKQWQQPQFAALLQQQLLQPVYNEQQLQELKQQGRAFAVAPVRGPAGINRGLGFVALRSLPEGFMVYEEAPLLSLQHTVNKCLVKACCCCGEPLGGPLFQLSHFFSASPESAQHLKALNINVDHLMPEHQPQEIVPCPGGCGEAFCSSGCLQRDTVHQQLCVGPLDEGAPLVAFKRFAIEHCENLLLVAAAIAAAATAAASVVGGSGEATTAAAKQLLSLLLQHEHGLWEETERTEDESPGTDSEAEEENELDRREIVTRGTELLLLGLREKSEVYNHLVSASLVSRLLSVFEHCNTDLHQANPLNAFVSRCLLNPMSGGSEALRHLLAEKEAVLFLLFGSSDRNEGEDTDFRGPGEGVPSLHAIRNYYASKPLPELAPPLEDPMVPTEGDLPKSPQNTGRAFPPMKGTAFYCSMARINHCCNPNMRIEVGARGCLRLRLIRGVGCGEELCVSYLEGVRGMEREERRQRLKAFGFDCSCHHCTSGL
ncbi:uncharacterized protein LOC34619052 [Cyclospora cayetanensis]|uniref:Uncharacterized protein LOC34619052 n=1 Tax=Cyclospora cayetanensis TaxID=88456 RepID=A0A6P6S297_9EIME|nr:uncharacterized protein LOC34619052 [Cyclospora cayetanensis]